MSLEEVYQRNLHHRTHRAGWLRAAVLGANDGLVSTASLMIGVSAANADSFLITAGIAGIVAGSMSMAVGEYVSVRSQNDVEESDRIMEMEHLALDPEGELLELEQIYIKRGLSQELAHQVAVAMHDQDPLAAHLRDESATNAGSICFSGKFHYGWIDSICWRVRTKCRCKSVEYRPLHYCWITGYRNH